MFVGWEGVGLCSYLLIGFYFHRKSASDAANKAFIVNRIGDAGFLLGMFTIAWYFGIAALHRRHRAWRAAAHFAIGDPGHHRRRAACCSSAPAASRRSFRSTSGCPTRWKAPPRSPP